MKILKRIFVVILLLFTMLSATSCDSIKKDPSEFNAFADQVLGLAIADNEMVINFMFKNPSIYGIERGSAYLYQPSDSNSAIGMILLNMILGQIDSFDYNELTFDQKMTYNIINELRYDVNTTITDEAYMGRTYLGSYLGYQAQLPIQLLNYNLRDKLDVENYFVYIDAIDETFQA